MDQLSLLDKIDSLAVFDEQSKLMSERLVAKMFSEVKKKVEKPQLAHYASFMMSYLKSAPTQMSYIVASVVLESCSANICNQSLQIIAETIPAAQSVQDKTTGMHLLNMLVGRLIELGKLQFTD